jgi:nicotinate phosphoribosyltransferase
LIAAGLEQALHYVLNSSFSEDAIAYLKTLDIFSSVGEAFFKYLSDFRFSGDVWALPEGTIFFGNEPVVQVTGPIIEAQILETFLINSINVQTMVASKAVRLCAAANGKPVIDFGSRRAHGPQASVLAARAAYLGGCDGTSNVLAGYEMGIPVYGTMAHSFVQFFDEELEAFRSFQEAFPNDTTLLVDTYDSIEGVRKAIRLQQDFCAIRLDSGNLSELAVETRRLLDEAGKHEIGIFASGDLNEEILLKLTRSRVPIDGFGVGTELVVSADAPTCDLVYKLVEIDRGGRAVPKLKSSENKKSLPFRKQIYRVIEDSTFKRDIVSRWGEDCPGSDHKAVPLLEPVIRDGELIGRLPCIAGIRERTRLELSQLPEDCSPLLQKTGYPVVIAPGISEVRDE